MAYWAASDLAQLLPQPQPSQSLVSGSAWPVTLVLFQTYIDERSAEFDAAAQHVGYSVPIPTSASQGYLLSRLVVGMGARADALEQIYPGASPKADRLRSAYEAALDRIMRGLLPIPGVAIDASQSGRVLPRSGGIASPLITASTGLPQVLDGAFDF